MEYKLGVISWYQKNGENKHATARNFGIGRKRLREWLESAKGGGIILHNTVYRPPPPSIFVFLSLWEGGRSDGTLQYSNLYNIMVVSVAQALAYPCCQLRYNTIILYLFAIMIMGWDCHTRYAYLRHSSTFWFMECHRMPMLFWAHAIHTCRGHWRYIHVQCK